MREKKTGRLRKKILFQKIAEQLLFPLYLYLPVGPSSLPPPLPVSLSISGIAHMVIIVELQALEACGNS